MGRRRHKRKLHVITCIIDDPDSYFNYGIIELTVERIESWLKLMDIADAHSKALKRHPQTAVRFCCTQYYEHCMVYVNTVDLDAVPGEEDLLYGEWLKLPEDIAWQVVHQKDRHGAELYEHADTETSLLNVYPNMIEWEASYDEGRIVATGMLRSQLTCYLEYLKGPFGQWQ